MNISLKFAWRKKKCSESNTFQFKKKNLIVKLQVNLR